MSSHALIMEGWRRFLKESRGAITEINGKPIHLYFQSNASPEFEIILYILTENSPLDRTKMFEDSFEVIGAIDCMEIDDCIPKTLQVGSVYRNSKYSGEGIGPMLYDLAFFVAGSMGHGLTSDRFVGSKKGARKRWASIEASPEYEKQKTNAGNDIFDYDGSTPDPDDDCEKDDDYNATDHSFIKKTVGESVLYQLEANHLDLLEDIMDHLGTDSRDEFLKSLRDTSRKMFQDEYDEEGE